jgi:cytochrome c556
MYRFMLTGLLALAIMITGVVQAGDEKPKTTKAYMKKAHAGAKSYLGMVKKAVEADNFKAAAKPMKGWASIAPHLAELKPSKGSEESWKEMTTKYADSVKALSKAVEDQDGDAAKKELKTIGGECRSCHTAHKGK